MGIRKGIEVPKNKAPAIADALFLSNPKDWYVIAARVI